MISIRSCAVATAMLATLTVAAPAPGGNPAPAPIPGDIDFVPFNESDPTLVKRKAYWGDFGEFSGWSSNYQDGQGTYVRSGDDAHYGAFGREHCWTDLFWVTYRVDASNWVRDETSVDCATTSQCYIEKVKSGERCNSWDLKGSITAGVGTEVLAKFLGYTGEIGFEAGGGAETCTTSESTTGCYWEDKLCHQAWRSDLTLVHLGYIRRRCDSGGDHTVWTHDFQVKVPIKETRAGCAAKCSDTSYPDSVPSP